MGDYHGTLERIAALAVPAFADWFGVHVKEPDGSIRRMAVRHQDPEMESLVVELYRRYPPDGDQPYGAPQFGAPGYGPPAPTPGTNGLAIGALVAGVAALVLMCCCLGIPAGIAAVVMGFIARGQIQKSGGVQGGMGLAIGGMVTGGIAVVLSIGLTILSLATGGFDGSYYDNY